MTPERTAREQSTTVVDVPAHARTLDTTTHDAASWLATLPESVVSWRPSATAWSIKEIIGHLIDSAAHNHQRFVRAELQADLVFPGYDQDDWVRAQAYHAAPWGPLLTLWQSYNLHLARVMVTMPASIRERRRETHNFHQIGFRSFSADRPVTLDDLMEDYVLHLEHHLAQVRDRARGASAAGESAT
jgi:DinB superfamily